MRKFGSVGDAEDDCARCAETRDERSVEVGNVAFSRRRVPASQRRPATSIELLMLTGTPCNAPRDLSSHYGRFGGLRLEGGTLFVKSDECIQAGIELVDPFKVCANQFDRGDRLLRRIRSAISAADRRVSSDMQSGKWSLARGCMDGARREFN